MGGRPRHDGRRALQKTSLDVRRNLALLEIGLPGLYGYQLSRRLCVGVGTGHPDGG
jgi:hypothetical protein